MNKNKFAAFIKKYPMSILLAIIALNLFSIAGSLKTSAKLDYKKLVCLQRGSYSKEVLDRKIGENGWYQCNILNN